MLFFRSVWKARFQPLDIPPPDLHFLMSNFFLDLRTLSFALMLVTGLMASVMFFVWRAQKNYPGTKFWVLSNFAGTLGFFMIGLRGFAPDFITIILGNLLAITTTAFALEGNRRFLGLRPDSMIPIAVLTGYFITLIFYTYIQPDEIGRIITASISASLLTFLSYRAFAEKPGLMNNVVYRTVGYSFLLFSILMFARMLATMTFSNISELYTPDWIQSLSFMMFLIFATVWSFNYVILNSERLHEELREKEIELLERATTDFLTGLGNKRAFEEWASSEVKRCRRYNLPVSMILIDLDHFKKINDTYGHGVGDRVLSEIGGLLQKMTRQHDHVARIGGEEFGLLLTHTDLETAHSVAESFRREINSHTIEHETEKLVITASFGVAELSRDDTLRSLTDRADANLYIAKELGRNRVVSNSRGGLRLFSQSRKK